LSSTRGSGSSSRRRRSASSRRTNPTNRNLIITNPLYLQVPFRTSDILSLSLVLLARRELISAFVGRPLRGAADPRTQALWEMIPQGSWKGLRTGLVRICASSGLLPASALDTGQKRSGDRYGVTFPGEAFPQINELSSFLGILQPP
jgi:hypothetical protein